MLNIHAKWDVINKFKDMRENGEKDMSITKKDLH